MTTSDATGAAPTPTGKVSAIRADGCRASDTTTAPAREAVGKAEAVGSAILGRGG